MEWTIELSFAKVAIQTKWIGRDLLVTVGGGEAHIGCAVLSIPRPSLAQEDLISCTSSVLNVTGHKDEAICRLLAEKACKKYGVTVLCTGGFHLDNMKAAQIKELMDHIENFAFDEK